MCILLTPLLYCNTTVLNEVHFQCFTELVSLRDIGKPTLRAEISNPNTSLLKAEERSPQRVHEQTLTVKRTHTKHTILS